MFSLILLFPEQKAHRSNMVSKNFPFGIYEWSAKIMGDVGQIAKTSDTAIFWEVSAQAIICFLLNLNLFV